MHLAKQHLDVGLSTNNIEAMLQFWQREVGLPLEEVLPTGGGNRQHRHSLRGGVLKINHPREPLPASGPAGYRELFLVDEGQSAPQSKHDPDGNIVWLVPAGFRGISGAAILVRVSNLAEAAQYYRQALGFELVASNEFRCGETLLFLEEDPSVSRPAEMRGQGYRYLTAQVWNADDEYAGILERGGAPGIAPRTMGEVARFGFVRDPDGNWLEISQRASLTGPLPPN